MISNLLNTLNKNPKKIIPQYDLIYTLPEHLSITRYRKKEEFEYFKNSRLIKNTALIKDINALAIPPAWSAVKISELSNTHILAYGFDARERKQYIYHPKWLTLKKETKFLKLVKFAEVLPMLRKRVNNDLEATKWTKNKVLALVIRLMEESHIRIGNSYYERRNKTYGLSTLRSRHLKIYKDRFKLEFKGKRGKKHTVTLRNKKLLRLINKCEEIPGWELFQYYDENHRKHKIDSTMVNNYIHDTCGDIFSAKDFRTWSATLITFDTLKNSSKKENKKKTLLKAIGTAAEALNNTRSVCKKYYVHPHVIDSYLNKIIDPYFEMAEKTTSKSEFNLQPNEVALKALIETYKPDLIKTVS